MRRRAFITLIGGATTSWPLAARAQQPASPVVGFLGIAPASGWAGRLAGFREGLRELGYVEGRNLAIEFRWGIDPAELTELAVELVKREVAVIVSGGNAATDAAKAVTSKVPIVFSAADDPVRLGYVKSFNRPGGNMTGGHRIDQLVLQLLTAAPWHQAAVRKCLLLPGSKQTRLLTSSLAARDLGCVKTRNKTARNKRIERAAQLNLTCVSRRLLTLMLRQMTSKIVFTLPRP
jgi:hypothetical protein